MRPIMISIFGFDIKAYGLFIAIAFIVGMKLAAHFAKEDGGDPEIVYDLTLYILVSALIGARLLEVLVNYKDYFAHPGEIFKIWNGGLTFYGGLIAVIIVSYIYVKKKKIDFYSYADYMAPSMAFGYMFGRIGCFFAGCCYGEPAAAGDLCVTFNHPMSFAPRGVCLYPTQAYGALSALIIGIILLIVRKRRAFKGQLFLLFFMLYAPARFMIEFIRDDARGLYFNNSLSTSQIIGIPFFFGTLVLYYILNKKSRNSST
ncbi:prolipoprotein diacylglyceryl transferase [Thermodesulfobacteriota bacterium]